MKALLKNIFGNIMVQYSISFLLYLYLQLVYLTSKKRVIFSDSLSKKCYNNENAIYAFWHNRLAFMPFARPKNIKVNVLTSEHRDGRIIALVMRVFSFGIIAGSTTRGGFSALKAILACVKSGESVAITPDGPKGPRNKINSNIVAISGMSGKVIIPMTYSCKRAYVFNSWDRFILPGLFNDIVIIYGKPIKVDNGEYKEKSEEMNNQLEIALNTITSEADKLVSRV